MLDLITGAESLENWHQYLQTTADEHTVKHESPYGHNGHREEQYETADSGS